MPTQKTPVWKLPDDGPTVLDAELPARLRRKLTAEDPGCAVLTKVDSDLPSRLEQAFPERFHRRSELLNGIAALSENEPSSAPSTDGHTLRSSHIVESKSLTKTAIQSLQASMPVSESRPSDGRGRPSLQDFVLPPNSAGLATRFQCVVKALGRVNARTHGSRRAIVTAVGSCVAIALLALWPHHKSLTPAKAALAPSRISSTVGVTDSKAKAAKDARHQTSPSSAEPEPGAIVVTDNASSQLASELQSQQAKVKQTRTVARDESAAIASLLAGDRKTALAFYQRLASASEARATFATFADLLREELQKDCALDKGGASCE